uniref:Sir2 family NAD-dependent protein deacetylase n=1 Tax=Marinovum algicola TaxID=42444 RepID=UPI0024B91E61
LEEVLGDDLLVITQNIDDLHERAGSRRVLHMHGELLSALCRACDGRVRWESDLVDLPPCPGCGVTELRPDVVWFGEIPYGMDRISIELARADLFVSIGTSGAVYPAAGFVAEARRAGAHLFISLHADALEEGVAHGASVYMLSDTATDEATAALAERHDRSDLLAGVDLTGSDDEVAEILMDLARQDNGPRSHMLAKAMVRAIDDSVGEIHKRPLREAGFSVLKAADIPSVLVEVGFLSTDRDLENLQDPEWRAKMARGIRDGILAWSLADATIAPLRRK